MLAPSTARMGGCCFLVCADAEMSAETNKSTSIGTRGCTVASDEQVLGRMRLDHTPRRFSAMAGEEGNRPV